MQYSLSLNKLTKKYRLRKQNVLTSFDMSEESLLQRVGLSRVEAKIYLSLLKSGPTSIRQLAVATNVNRGTVYESIKSLVTTGLVSVKVVGSRSKYSAEGPEKIQQLINDKQRQLRTVEKDVTKLMPELMAYSKATAEEPKVKFYEGDEGVANILRDVLATTGKLDKKEYYVYSSRSLRQYLYRRFPNFTTQRIHDGIFAKVIGVGTGGDPAELSERKIIEDDSFETSSSYNIIYGDKVALISVSSDLTPYGVVIEEPGVAAMQRLLFSRLWNSLK
jgi:sugar-specific transcriptional regulator TrmB